MTNDLNEFSKKLLDVGKVLHEKFNNFAKAMNTLTDTLQKTSIQVNRLNVTNYNCICGSKLIITGHNNTEIFYECIDCGKSYKAKKNKLLGRFK